MPTFTFVRHRFQVNFIFLNSNLSFFSLQSQIFNTIIVFLNFPVLLKYDLWARLASSCQLGLISDPQISSKLQDGINDPKGQESKIYTMMKDRVTFYDDHTGPVTSCSKIQYVP